MKRLAILFISILTLISCGDEVEFNTPGFQGNREYGLWRAEFTTAAIDANGFLTITGGNNIETVELKVPSAAVGTYIVGDWITLEARYTDGNGNVFTTNNRPDPSVSIYPEYGFIKIDEINNNTFTGTFEFLAFDNSGLNSIGYNEGVFFKVPLTSGSIPPIVTTCVDTELIAQEARADYIASFDQSLEYVDVDTFIAACDAYNTALRTQRDYCGDVSGEITETIFSLAGCVFRCDFAERNRVSAQTAFEAATIGNYEAACTNYIFYLQEQIVYCGDPDGSIQATIDDLDCNDDDSDGVPNVFEDFDGNGDLEDDDIDGDGIPNYLDDDDDGDGIPTINEAKDADGNPIDTDGDGDVDYLDDDDDGDGLPTNSETGDTDGDGVDNYLDNDDDGDGILTQFESSDTDGDGIDNYLDDDDDGDGILTVDENPDPDGDGDPADAVDTDGDGIPDYLDNM